SARGIGRTASMRRKRLLSSGLDRVPRDPACHLRERRTGRGRGQPVRHRYSAPDELAIPGRWLRRWGGVAAVAVACSLLAPAARTAMPAAQLARISAAAGLLGTDSPTPVAQLEDRADKLSKQYRGQLEVLSGAEAAAKAAAGRARVLDGRLDAAHRQLARLAA